MIKGLFANAESSSNLVNQDVRNKLRLLNYTTLNRPELLAMVGLKLAKAALHGIRILPNTKHGIGRNQIDNLTSEKPIKASIVQTIGRNRVNAQSCLYSQRQVARRR